MDRTKFEKLVKQAMQQLPAEFREKLENARQQAMLAKEQRFIDRFSAHAAKAAQVQSRVKA